MSRGVRGGYQGGVRGLKGGMRGEAGRHAYLCCFLEAWTAAAAPVPLPAQAAAKGPAARGGWQRPALGPQLHPAKERVAPSSASAAAHHVLGSAGRLGIGLAALLRCQPAVHDCTYQLGISKTLLNRYVGYAQGDHVRRQLGSRCCAVLCCAVLGY